jgi:hypothetical protein
LVTLVVGDVHGCRRELEELLDRVGPDRVIAVGDMFTKGPEPGGIWDVIRRSGIEAVLGNHDDRLLESVDGDRPDDRGARRCIAALDDADPDRRWLGWLRDLPLVLEVAGWTVVHAGIHPTGSLELTTRKMALYWRRWPDDAPGAPLWHQVYTGDRRVIFGHDAMRGLIRVERAGEPLLIGLDTGCVYGGQLSGYVVETDRIVQVQAKQVYKVHA